MKPISLLIARTVLYWMLMTLWAPAIAANVIQIENAKLGSTAWELTTPRQSTEIEGYASATSVNRGGTINLFVRNLVSPSYILEVYRAGWYGGAGARKVFGPITRQSVAQPEHTVDANGMVECKWLDPYALTIPHNATDPSDWASGIYLVKLTAGTGGPQSYIIFTVRDDARVPSATYLFQSSVTTWQAYNNWGGKSLYAHSSSSGSPARKVSFDRPYVFNAGTGDFLGTNYYGWEIHLMRFLEREGYDVSYATNIDVHALGATLLNRHRAFLSVGHDEYWSYQMKSAVQRARDIGMNIGFFSSNAVYWQVRFEPNSVGAPNRTMVAYKEATQSSDPLWLDSDASNNKYVTARFRDLSAPPYNVVDPVARPENGLIGVMYHGDPVGGDIIVSDATSWVFAGTNVSNGTHLYGLLGYETDTKFANGNQPAGLMTIGTSPDPWGFSHMTLYQTASGSLVFATGSMQWNWGLDAYLRNSYNPIAAQATRNILARFASIGILAPVMQSVRSAGQFLKISWQQSGSGGIVSNRLYRSTSSGEPYIELTTISATTSYTDNSVQQNVKYYYVVSAIDGVGSESGLSAELSGSPKK